MAMWNEYTEMRRILKERNLWFRTIYPACLKVFFEEGAKTYNTVEDATVDLVTQGFLVTTIELPLTDRNYRGGCCGGREVHVADRGNCRL